MIKVGLISDTHSFLDDLIFEHFRLCDEVWHAGDFGSLEVLEKLKGFKPFRGVFGNIDGNEIRQHLPENNIFEIAGAKILMTHIGGYPGKYAPGIKVLIEQEKPALFISGHSHILRVMHDKKLNCLHINPGAAGNQGWHKVKTIVRFDIDEGTFKNLEVIELGKRGAIH